jgi:hypothetical protein
MTERNKTMPKVLQIKAEPLTAEAYRPFGQVVGVDKVQMKIVNDRFWMGVINLGGKACLVVVAPPTVNLESRRP